MSAIGGTILGLVAVVLGIVAAILVLIYVIVPICKGLGWCIGAVFTGIGFLLRHIFEFIFGMIGDTVRSIGAVIAMIVLTPLAVLNVIFGRWSAATHFAGGVKREIGVGLACLYRVALKRPLRLLFLDGLLEGVEQRVPEAMAAAPGPDRPSRRTGTFTGYTILGSLKGGGSGAKLYIAEPGEEIRRKYRRMPDRVVIKSFALAEGSSLPQIVRESRALECAKKLGLVFEHAMDANRFYYVMPYHDGDNLAIVTRQLHGASEGDGLGQRQLDAALGYVRDLAMTLETYHREGLWHKDVKPENVIVHGGHAHLVDLGLVTPLRSAMTLTTHGTEYFRDPEMVRQALQGVKVHQVNGAKFDVYAVGAVLYFMIENDFPAHGALSRFSRRSPEAVKWIVRRAMADYHHRYDSSQQMLDDLNHVLRADDPFAVKPASLPSMHGMAGDVDAEPVDDEPVFAAAPAGAPHTTVPPAADAASNDAAREQVLPEINVTNWWTGAYNAVATAVNDAVAEAEASDRDVAVVMRHVSVPDRTVAPEAAPRRSARELRRDARHARREVRRAARHARHRANPGRPSFALAAVCTVFLLAIVGGTSLLVVNGAGSGQRTTPDAPMAVTMTTGESRPAVLLVVDEDVDATGAHRAGIDELLAAYTAHYDVINENEDDVRLAFAQWQSGQDLASQHELDEAFKSSGLYGVVYVTADQLASGNAMAASLICSSHDDARSWRYAPKPAPSVDRGSWLVINDHPSRYSEAVEPLISEQLDRLGAEGYGLVTDDDVEVQLRTALPAGRLERIDALSVKAASLLRSNGFNGIVCVYRTDDDPNTTSVGVRTIPIP